MMPHLDVDGGTPPWFWRWSSMITKLITRAGIAVGVFTIAAGLVALMMRIVPPPQNGYITSIEAGPIPGLLIVSGAIITLVSTILRHYQRKSEGNDNAPQR